MNEIYGAAQVPIARIYCRSGEFANSTFSLVPNDRITVGRAPGCNIKFSQSTPNISRIHCVIEFDGSMVWITDNNSTNGTFFGGGVRLVPNRRTAIARGKSFYLGSVNILFEVL